MSIEQTNQLLQLILNCLLLVTACVIVLSGMLLRHTAMTHRLHACQREYFECLEGAGTVKQARLVQLKIQLRQLRHHYRMTHLSVVMAHYALLFCVASALGVAFRTLIDANWLIHLALVLFVIGISILLLSVGLTLLDLCQANHSLWQELHWILTLGNPARTLDKPLRLARSRPQRPALGDRSPRSLSG